MDWMTRSDVVILALAAFVAVMSLVHMMRKRHDEVVASVREQIAAHKKRPKKKPAASDEKKRPAA